MQIDETTRRYNEIFAPGLLEKSFGIFENGKRFAYYTSADTAMKVIRNEELWFRNAKVMNDFSEISYGLRLIEDTFSGPVGARFREAVDDIFEGTIQQASDLLGGWEQDCQLETYIACISVHDESEDKSGRLSMWRAYGDTAIIVNNTPMLAVTDLLGVYSTPVMYLSRESYEVRLNMIADEILKNRSYLKSLGQEVLVGYLHHMLFHTAIATKHTGFAEEQEWRLYFRPNENDSPLMRQRVEVLGGIAQIVYALPLADKPDQGLHGVDIPSLIDRIIIGPTEFPYVSVRAFQRELEMKNVSDVENKVFASDIPLRNG